MTTSDRFKMLQSLIMLKTLCLCAVVFEYYMARLAPKVDTGNTSLVICSIACISVLGVLFWERRKEKAEVKEVKALSPEMARYAFLNTHSAILEELKDLSMLHRVCPTSNDIPVIKENLTLQVKNLEEAYSQVKLPDSAYEALGLYVNIKKQMVNQACEEASKVEDIHRRLASTKVVSKLMNESTDPLFTMELS